MCERCFGRCDRQWEMQGAMGGVRCIGRYGEYLGDGRGIGRCKVH